MKATAAFLAMAYTSTLARSSTRAQGTPTAASDWNQPVNVGGEAQLGFTAEFPFHAIAPHWSGDIDFPAAVELQVSGDGETYSQPYVVGPAHTDAGPTDRDGRIFGDLVFTEQSRIVRYRGLDADGRQVGVPGLSFTYIDATGGPTLNDITTSSLAPSLDRPPIIARDEWGAGLAYGGADRAASEWTPEYQTVEHVVIHHSETPSFRDPLAEMRSIHYYHAITRGWGDIGYNYLVDFMGNVYEGRVGGDNVVGGHAYQYAYGSSGICSMGSFKETGPTPECIAGLTWITAWCARSLDALGRSDFHEQPNLPTICGHRDVNDSTCPGDGLYADLPTVRTAVADVISGASEVLVDPEFSPGQIVETIVEGANVRQQPGLEGEVSAELPFASVMQVVDGPSTVDDYAWYELDGSGGSGWVASSMVTPSDAAPPVGRFAKGEDVVVNTDFMNIRTETSLKGLVVATMPFGASAAIVSGPMPASGYRWYELSSEYGDGWAVEQYLAYPGEETPDLAFVIGDVVEVDDPDGVRLRSGPGTGTRQIASLPPGTVGTVVDGPKVGDGHTWMMMQTALGTGWSAQEYFALSDEPAPVSKARFVIGQSIVVDTDSLNLREHPGIDGPLVTTLGTGILGEIIDGPDVSSNFNWYQIETRDHNGWVVDQFLAAADDAEVETGPKTGDTVYINTDGINLRRSANLEGDVVTVLFTNETAAVLEGPAEADELTWFKLQSDRGTGWGAAQYLGVGNPDPLNSQGFGKDDRVAVDTDGLNLRASASIDSDVVKILLTDTVATVVDGPREGNGYSWFQLETEGSTGWAVDEYLRASSSSEATIGDRLRVFDGELNLRSGAGIEEDVIAVLPDGAYVDVIADAAEADGRSWLRVRSSRFGTGWAVSEYLR